MLSGLTLESKGYTLNLQNFQVDFQELDPQIPV